VSRLLSSSIQPEPGCSPRTDAPSAARPRVTGAAPGAASRPLDGDDRRHRSPRAPPGGARLSAGRRRATNPASSIPSRHVLSQSFHRT